MRGSVDLTSFVTAPRLPCRTRLMRTDTTASRKHVIFGVVQVFAKPTCGLLVTPRRAEKYQLRSAARREKSCSGLAVLTLHNKLIQPNSGWIFTFLSGPKFGGYHRGGES